MSSVSKGVEHLMKSDLAVADFQTEAEKRSSYESGLKNELCHKTAVRAEDLLHRKGLMI